MITFHIITSNLDRDSNQDDHWTDDATQEQNSIFWADNTYLLSKGKYQCIVDLQCDWFGTNQHLQEVLSLFHPNQLSLRSHVQ